MAVHRQVNSSGIYFITFTCFDWLPLIHNTNAYELVYRFFNVVNTRHELLAYVIMPNHVHFLLNYIDISQSLNTIIGNGKRFLAYQIVKRLKESCDTQMLRRLSHGVKGGESKNRKLHAVWRESFDVKECWTGIFIGQKLGYIHHNPVSGK